MIRARIQKYTSHHIVQRAIPFVRQSSIHVIFQALSMALPFFLLPIITHYMAPSEYGRFALYMVIISFVSPLIFMGFDQVFAYGYFKRTEKQQEELVSNYIMVVALLAMGLELCVLILGPFLHDVINLTFKSLISIVLYSTLLFFPLVGQTVAFIKKNLFLQGVFIVGRIVIAYAISLPLITMVSSKWHSLLIGQVIASLALSLVAIRYIHKEGLLKQLKWSKTSVHEIITIGGPMVFFTISTAGVGVVDRMFIQYFLGTPGIGVYAIPYSMMSAVMMFMVALSRGLGPTIIRLASEKTPRSLHIVVKVFFGYWALIVMAFTAAALMGGPVLKILTSSAYAHGGSLIPVLALSFMFNTLFIFNSSLLVLEKKTGILALLSILAGVISATLNWELIPQFGLMGAAWADVIAFGTLSILTFVVMLYYVPFPWKSAGREITPW